MTIKDRPHYTVSAKTLAEWIERQPEKWWSVDGDMYLMSVVSFPCPGDEIVPAILKRGTNLLLRAKRPDSRANGEEIATERLDGEAFSTKHHEKLLLLSWADADDEWLLLDDVPDPI